MIESGQIIDPFFRELYRLLTAQLTQRIEQLASGSATKITEDPTTTAEKYAAQVYYIKALTDVLDACEEIEKGIHGSRSGSAGGD